MPATPQPPETPDGLHPQRRPPLPPDAGPSWQDLAGFGDLGDYPDELYTDADLPPVDEDYLYPDPVDVSSRPAEFDGLTEADLEALPGTVTPGRRVVPPWPLAYGDHGAADGPAGLLPRDGTGPGCGFADGGVLDTLPAGVPLAGFADHAGSTAATLTDDALIGLLRGWRRVASWAQAQEMATMAELMRRRPAPGYPPADPGELPVNVSEFTEAEVAAALTLTTPAAQGELALAYDLACHSTTWQALAAGWIDLPRARVITTMLAPLSAEHAAQVESGILPRAADLTTAQLRRALHRAILKVDPAAARHRREQAERTARVETWADPEGTASLAGRNLPPAQTLAASKRLTQIATAWKHHGAQGGMDLLRAHAYLALLNGLSIDLPPAALLPPLPATEPRQPGRPPSATGVPDPLLTGPRPSQGVGLPQMGVHPQTGLTAQTQLPPQAGLINLTVPLTTLLQLGDAPGEAAGFGPLDADTTRQLACALAGHRATRWHITITGPTGFALAHGTARGNPAHSRGDSAHHHRGSPTGPATITTTTQPASPTRATGSTGVAGTGGVAAAAEGAGEGRGGAWTVKVTAEPIAAGSCDHRHREPGYRPSPSLQALVRARSSTCTYYGCGRQAVRCDLDHTIPHDHGGPTCECNLAPLCRYHHRVKQAQRWKLQHLTPGVMAWLTPAGRRYITLPTEYRC